MTTPGDKKLSAQEQLQAQQTAVIMAALKAAGFNMGSSSGGNTSQTQRTVTKLTPASARALLEQAGASIQYGQTLSDKEVNDFIEKFNTEQNRQIEQVIRSAQSKVTPGASDTAVQNEVSSILQTEFPSFFKPTDFAKDFLWAKVNFGKTETLGGQNLQIIQQVREAIQDFNLLGVSDAEALKAAKDIAMGKKTIADYKAELSQVAQKEYPNLAQRFASTPGLTTKDIASPVINMLAKTWEVDPSTIGFDNPIVQKWLHPTSADGKETTYGYTDALREAMNDPKWQYTTAANESARDAATALIRAMHGGV